MQLFLQILKRRLMTLGGFATGAAIVALCAPTALVEFERGAPPIGSAESAEAAEPVSPSRADRLVRRHGCWTGAAPADMSGQVPGHVVATPTGGRTVYSASLVGPALDQTFGRADAGLLVHAFCR